MKFPWFGIAAAVTTAIGGYSMYWYSNLSKSAQEEADSMAADYAKSMYGKGLDELTSHQLGRVQELVKSRFAA